MNDAIHPESPSTEPTVQKTHTQFKSPSLTHLITQGDPNLAEGNVDLKAMLEAIEVQYLEAALKSSHGVVSHAAQKLGLRRTTFIEKMRKHHIVRQEAE